MARATKAVVAQRIEEVLRLRIDGAEYHDVKEYASAQGWGVSARHVWNYMHQADDLLKERLEKDRDRLISRHVAQRRNLYSRALKAGQYAVALAVADSEAKLEQLFPGKVVNLNTGGTAGGAPVRLSFIEVRAAEEEGARGEG
jgi:hypothetical protein